LHAQLDCLIALHGRTTIDAWKALAASGDWDALVGRLLAEHYDPAYHRSIERNFSRISTARRVSAGHADSDAFSRIATELAGD
jgi:tRNA 2-selenouridine synthase